MIIALAFTEQVEVDVLETLFEISLLDVKLGRLGNGNWISDGLYLLF